MIPGNEGTVDRPREVLNLAQQVCGFHDNGDFLSTRT